MVNIAPFDGTMPTLHTDDQIQQHIASLDANHPPVIIEHAIVGDGTFFLFWGRLTQPATSKHWTLHHFQLIENKTADTASFFTNTGCERLSVERTDKTLALVATRPTKASTTDYILHVKLELSKHFNNRPTTSSSSSSKRPSLFAHKTLDQILKSKSVFALIDHICDKNNMRKEDFFRLQPTIRDFFSHLTITHIATKTLNHAASLFSFNKTLIAIYSVVLKKKSQKQGNEETTKINLRSRKNRQNNKTYRVG